LYCSLTYGRLCSTPCIFLNLCVKVEDDGHISNLPNDLHARTILSPCIYRHQVRALKETKHKNVIELIDHLPDAVTEDQYWVVMKYARKYICNASFYYVCPHSTNRALVLRSVKHAYLKLAGNVHSQMQLPRPRTELCMFVTIQQEDSCLRL